MSRRMLTVPYFRQRTDFWCGPAVLQMLLALHGIRVDQRRLAHLLRTTKSYGTTRSSIAPVIRTIGLGVTVKRRASLTDLQNALEHRLPVMVNYYEDRDPSGPYGHYSLVVGMNRETIIFNGPLFGKGYRISRKIFGRLWNKRERWMLTINR